MKSVNKFKLGALAAVIAATSQPAMSEDFLEEITVTARKREESLQSVPVSVTAMTAADIDKRGLVSVADLADQAPGFVVTDNFSGKTDRTVQTFTLRGFSPSSGVEATTSMFIDGVPVSSTTAVSSIGSPERVEILRGPQSAYFGRNTFAGAVNVVNKVPAEEFGGSVAVTLGDYDYKRLRGEVEGSIIENKLAIRVAGETYEKDGAWDNAYDGSRLGDQKTTMANIYLLATPTDSLTIKAFGFVSEDEDGPAASAFISAYDINDFMGNVLVQGQANCTLGSFNAPYFCGSVPTKADSLSYNTAAIPGIKTLLQNSTNRLTDTDSIDDYGMNRKYQHSHVVVDWDIADTGFTLSSLTGLNHEEWILLNDIDHYGYDGFNYGYLVERQHDDISQEFRLSYDNGGDLRGSLGISYLDASTKGSQTSLLSFGPPPAQVTAASKNTAETKGVFFGVSYSLTDALTASVEGRYQTDEIAALTAAGVELVSKSFDSFLPRLILDYQLNDDTMLYGSFSQGVNPSAFNLGLLSVSDFVADAARDAGVTLTVEPEEVDNYEIGAKGSALEGNLNYAVAAYYAQWTKQINRVNLVVLEPGASQATSFSGVANTGEVDLYGLELEANWAPTENVRVNAGAAYTGSDIKDHSNLALSNLSGITDFSGKEQPGISKYSANVGVQYNGIFSGTNDTPWFARVDYVYKSGQWTNQANFLKTEDIHRVNLRAGITLNQNIDLQAYVNNVFDNDEYTSAYDYYAFQYDFAYFGNNSGMVMGLPKPRTIGFEAKYNF